MTRKKIQEPEYIADLVVRDFKTREVILRATETDMGKVIAKILLWFYKSNPGDEQETKEETE
jgi:hypothetical protein